MGDKSPKSNQKKTNQKQEKTKSVANTKRLAMAAKQVPSKKK